MQIQSGIVDRMADLMREMAFAGQTVTADALALRGDFTRDEIERHGKEAADKARADSIRRVNEQNELSRRILRAEIARFGIALIGTDARGLPRYRIRADRVPA